jgi:hypothetical protein
MGTSWRGEKGAGGKGAILRGKSRKRKPKEGRRAARVRPAHSAEGQVIGIHPCFSAVSVQKFVCKTPPPVPNRQIRVLSRVPNPRIRVPNRVSFFLVLVLGLLCLLLPRFSASCRRASHAPACNAVACYRDWPSLAVLCPVTLPNRCRPLPACAGPACHAVRDQMPPLARLRRFVPALAWLLATRKTALSGQSLLSKTSAC